MATATPVAQRTDLPVRNHGRPAQTAGAGALLLAMALVVPAQAAPPSSSARVDALFAPLDQPDAPGCAVAVMRNEKIVYEKGYGLASLEHGRPIEPQKTVFNIASSSKQFTAASVLLLVRDGKLSLDDDIRKFIPELPDYGHPITLNHLLHHTSGLRDYYTLLELAFVSPVDYTTDAQTLAAITRQKALDFVPGSTWGYSSSNYFLLGQIVQRVSGQPLRDFARDRIFLPLGMRSTQFLRRYDQIVPHVATAYRPLPEGGYAVDMSNWMTAGPSGLRTTVADLARWDSNFYTGKVGGSWLPAQLQQRGRLNDGSEIDYARGLIVDHYRGQETVSHDGSFAGYRAELLRFPRQKFAVAVLCNTAHSAPAELAHGVADIYLAGTLQAEPKASQDAGTPREAAAADMEEFGGLYWNPAQSLVRRIEKRGAAWFYVRSADNATELVAVGTQRLRMKDTQPPTEVSLVTGADGSRTLRVGVVGAGIVQGGASDFVKVEPFAAKSRLDSYAGEFYSAELLSYWQLTAAGDQLLLRSNRDGDTVLLPAFKHALFYDGVLLRFQHDAAGQVSGFLVDAGRARNIRFEKVTDRRPR